MRAITEVSWPATVLGAVDNAGLRAFAALGLTRQDFAHPLDLGLVKSRISSASKAIAAGPKPAPEHRKALLEPFVLAGSSSAATAIEAIEGKRITGGGKPVRRAA